jgi:hypothetical protein
VLLTVFVWWEGRAEEPILPLHLFRSPIFSVANAMGFTIGMAMFGAIIFIPLFLQIVYGVSPTSSGCDDLPLMAGCWSPRILSGRAISRIGRYKAFPIAGTACSSSACTCSRGSTSAPRRGSPPCYMVVVGVGLGLVMQVLVLVVQNDVAAAGDRRRHVDGDVLPLGRAAPSASRSSGDLRVAPLGRVETPAASRRRASRQRRPPQSRAGRRHCRRPCTPTS